MGRRTNKCLPTNAVCFSEMDTLDYGFEMWRVRERGTSGHAAGAAH